MYKELFEKMLLETFNNDEEVKIKAFYRKETLPSLQINLQTGQWHDFGTDQGGDALFFIKKFYGLMNDDDVESEFLMKKILSGDIKTLSTDYVNDLSKNLKENHRSWLHGRGLTDVTIEKYHLGVTEDGLVSIPIINDWGIISNIKFWNPNGVPKYSSLPFRKENLYPIQSLDTSLDYVILVEGEFDALILQQEGFNALTSTVGIKFKSSFIKYLKTLFKNVYTCFDCDDAGKRAAKKLKLKNMTIPLEGLDVNDYYLHDPENFKENIERLMLEATSPNFTEDVPQVSLYESLGANWFEKPICVSARIIGKDATYTFPTEMQLKCTKCGQCDGKTQKIKIETKKVLGFIGKGLPEINQYFKSLGGCPKKCNCICSIEKVEHLQSVQLESSLKENDGDFNYVSLRGYVLQEDMPISSNKVYSLVGEQTFLPKDMKNIFFVESASEESKCLNFVHNASVRQRLSKFQVPLEGKVSGKLEELIYQAEQITGIKGRSLMHTAMLLTYFSPLSFNFGGRVVENGRIETTIIGDTRTGKSEAALRLKEYFEFGDFITTENSSIAGIVGGVAQSQDGVWHPHWGVFPQNDRGIVVLDEFSGFPEESIGLLSGVRSSGIAEIAKIATVQKTWARTRNIFISNPRSGNNVSAMHGIQELKKLWKNQEDIARVDLCYIAKASDVNIEAINSNIYVDLDNTPYTKKELQDLLFWSLSRKIKNISFTKDAEDLVLKYAIKQGNKYISDIPLVSGASQRLKIAKVAVAIATMVYSSDVNGNIIVLPEHVDEAYRVLEEIYNHDGLGYGKYCELIRKKEEATINSRAIVKKMIKNLNLAIHLSQSYFLTLDGLRQFNASEDVTILWNEMAKAFFIEETYNGKWVKSKMFNELLSEMEVESS